MDTEKEEKEKLNWGILSTYRSELMCISIIGILCCHLLSNEAIHGVEHSWLSVILMYGNCFVDAFMFLSGLGLYYSFSKNRDVKTFYKKRFIKIIPAYIIIALPTLIIYNIINGGSVAAVLCDFFFVTFLTTGVEFAWFILAILVLYLLFPVFYGIIYRRKSLIYNLIATIILVCFFVGCSLLLKYFVPDFYDNIDIALERVPAFIIGMYFGSLCKNKCNINVFEILAMIICFVGGLFLRHKSIISGYYTCSLIGISIIMIFAVLINAFQSVFKKPADKVLAVLKSGGGVHFRSLFVPLRDAIVV